MQDLSYLKSIAHLDLLVEVWLDIKKRSEAPLLVLDFDAVEPEMDVQLVEDGWVAVDVAFDGETDVVIYQKAL